MFDDLVTFIEAVRYCQCRTRASWREMIERARIGLTNSTKVPGEKRTDIHLVRVRDVLTASRTPRALESVCDNRQSALQINLASIAMCRARHMRIHGIFASSG